MNPDNCLPFSLSPSHSSFPQELHSSQNHHFSLGLVNEAMENHLQNQEWNLMNGHGGGGEHHIPKVADFLGVSNKSDSHSGDLSLYNGIQPNETNYLFQSNSLMPVQNSLGVLGNDCYDLQENSNNLQALTLSMGSGKGLSSSSSCETARVDNGSTNVNNAIVEANPKRNLDTFGQRTSIYRGVTRHRWTGRYEAHLWDNTCRREGQSRKGRQVYLGGYDKEDKAARSYDLAALKYWGTSTTTNFPITTYEKELEEMKNMTRQEFVASIRRKSSGFSRGASMYRGVTRHHQHGRWQARIGRVAGNKDLYLGTFGTEEEAAEAYDIAAIKFRGLNAVTNFDMNRYDVKSILESNTLPIGGGAAKRLKEAQAIESSLKRDEMLSLPAPTNFHYLGSSMNPIQAYPLNVHHTFDQNQTLLTLQNHQDLSQHHFSSPQDANNYQSYIQTQLQLQQQQQQQQQQSISYNSNLYDNYLHGAHGMLGTDNASPAMETDSSCGSYCAGGYLGNNHELGMGLGSGSGSSGANTSAGPAHEHGLGLTKVDYDVRPGSSTYGGWSTEESGQGSGAGFFSMWNDG